MKVIKANTPCFISEVGHNNFVYPAFNDGGLSFVTEDIQNPIVKSWVCNNKGLKAIETSTTKIKDLYGDPNIKIIVWVHEDDIKSD